MHAKTQEIIFYIVTVGTIALLLLGGFIIQFVSMYKRKQRQNQIEKELMASKFSESLLQSQLEIQEKTLSDVSQEIHDNIGQVLSLAKLNLFTIDADDRENLNLKLKASKDLVTKAIVDLRDLSHTMNTDYVEDLGLMRAIEYELEMIQKSGVLKTRMEIIGNNYKFDKQKELIAFRIIQEVINNTIKHAQASFIAVNALFEERHLELTVTDDGVGMDIQYDNDGNNKAGLGIRNMQSRAKMIDGNFTIKSAPGNGTSIILTIYKENPPANETNREN
jgi:two-component system NarL family sensor kinase